MPSPGRTSCSWWTVAALGALSLLVLPGVARADPPRARAVDPSAVDEEPRPEPPSPRLALAGGLLFGSSYAISLIAATVSMTSKDAQLPELYAPLVGPWIAIPNVLPIQKRRVGGDPAASGMPTGSPCVLGLGVLGVAQMLPSAPCASWWGMRSTSTPSASASLRSRGVERAAESVPRALRGSRERGDRRQLLTFSRAVNTPRCGPTTSWSELQCHCRAPQPVPDTQPSSTTAQKPPASPAPRTRSRSSSNQRPRSRRRTPR